MGLISLEEAKKKNLSGSDTIKRTHAAYLGGHHKDFFVVELNREACNLFSKSIYFSNQRKIKEHANFYKKLVMNGSQYQLPENIIDIHKILIEMDMNLEYFYISTGFELYFKSWLIQNDYLIHIIDKEHSPELKRFYDLQKNRPIRMSEIFAITNFMYDDSLNVNRIDGLLNTSIHFAPILTEPDYYNVLQITEVLRRVVNDYRKLRNHIHLPGEFTETSLLKDLESIDFIIDFINTRIVNNTNSLILKHGFKPWLSLAEFTY